MRNLLLLISFIFCASCFAADDRVLTEEEIKSLVTSVTEASNKMMLKGSTLADVDALFALYTADFVYVHDVYGGTYTREHLYGNSAKYVKSGHYKATEGRYKIVQIMPGLNAAAVQRLEVASGKTHLTVFEFKGLLVSKVIEYWK